MRRIVGLFVLCVVSAGAAFAADELTLSVSNARPQPGSSVVFTVTAPASIDPNIGVVLQSNDWPYNVVLKTPPYSVTLDFGADVLDGVGRFQAAAFVGDKLVTSNQVALTISRGVPVSSLTFFNEVMVLYANYDSRDKLDILARYQDGDERQLGPEEAVFTVTPADTANSGGLVIDTDGYLKATKVGRYSVKGTFGGQSASTTVVVEELPADLQGGDPPYSPPPGGDKSIPLSTGGSVVDVEPQAGGSGGCTVGSVEFVDPILPAMTLLALFGLAYRVRRQRTL